MKLLAREPQTDALLRTLADWPVRVSSELIAVELGCVAERRGRPAKDVVRLLDGLVLLPLSAAVLARAQRPFAAPQRALDALHLATVAQAAAQLDVLITYDETQRRGAAGLPLDVLTPT